MCAENEVCTGGACVCAPGAKLCGGSCMVTATSFSNCGACGNQCKNAEVCTKGSCAAPTSSWQMLGYDGRHAGENPLETGKPPLDLSWSVRLASGTASAPVIDEGRVYVTARDSASSKYSLFSLALSDGSQLNGDCKCCEEECPPPADPVAGCGQTGGPEPNGCDASLCNATCALMACEWGTCVSGHEKGRIDGRV